MKHTHPFHKGINYFHKGINNLLIVNRNNKNSRICVNHTQKHEKLTSIMQAHEEEISNFKCIHRFQALMKQTEMNLKDFKAMLKKTNSELTTVCVENEKLIRVQEPEQRTVLNIFWNKTASWRS